MEQAVLERGAGHAHVVGKLEAALEGAGGDAAMQVAAITVAIGNLAGNAQAVLLLDDLDVLVGEAGHREGDPVAVFASLLDVVGRIAGAGALIGYSIEKLEDPDETDGRAEQRRKVESTHG